MGLRILGTGSLHGEMPIVVNRMVAIDLHNPPPEQVDSSPSKYGIWNLSGELKTIFDETQESNMTGTLLQGINECPSRKPLPNLAYFMMDDNKLHGKITDWLVQLDSLVGITLAHKLLEGPILVSIGSLQNPVVLMLEENKLNGTLPDSLGQLSKLSYLDVSSNQLTGANWIPPFQISFLLMSSCVLGPSLPPWLKSQNKIAYLDVSNASIFGFIPNWFWDISSRLTFLNTSHNELEGWLPNSMLVALSSDCTRKVIV
ncbi:unnamed protein product [Vicia faba]|uniref:Uncharacterized protein n=1 Tax=Vicia faba TaxID=3906 RepID=A0AAV1API2_VICFA|nr:unnamed protein product [Vicia faba]